MPYMPWLIRLGHIFYGIVSLTGKTERDMIWHSLAGSTPVYPAIINIFR